MNPNATITDEQFEAYLAQIRALVEGPFEELQKEVEVTNAFPDEFYELARENDLYRFYLPACYGGWNLSELEILRVQEEFSRGPGGMRMHLHHAADMNWRILDDYGKPELKARHMQRFQDKGVYCNFAITEQTGGTGADIHATALKLPDGTYLLNGEKCSSRTPTARISPTSSPSPTPQATRTAASRRSSCPTTPPASRWCPCPT